MKSLALASVLAISALSSAQVQIQPGSNWSAAGIYDFTHRQAVGGVDLKVYTFTKVFGKSNWSLDLHSFLGTSKNGAMCEALSLGKTFFLANQAYGYVGIGGDQIGGFAHPGICATAGIYVTF